MPHQFNASDFKKLSQVPIFFLPYSNDKYQNLALHDIMIVLFGCLFCCFTFQVNSYDHGGTVSSPNHTFSWTSLTWRLTSTSCISDNNPS